MKTIQAGAATLGLILMSIPALTPSTDSNVMLGRSPDDIIEMFGVPDVASISAPILKFRYTDKNKKAAVFAFHEGVAIMVPDAGFAPQAITRPPEDMVFCGQSVRAAALRLGSAESIIMGSQSAVATYADGTEVTMALGRVFPPE